MSAPSHRLATPADAPAIAALVREAYAKWVPIIGREPMPMTVNYEEAVRDHRFDLAHTGETLCGLLETAPHGDELLIVNVAVAPAFQGRGLGKRLLTRADEIAAAEGFKGVRLYTNQKFAANIALYLSVGYVVEREEPRYGGITVHMVKPRDA